jgi:hypothetical protein
MENKQTAVEWFNQQLVDRQCGNGDSRSWDDIYEQAKAMEKEQEQLAREESYNEGWFECTQYIMKHTKFEI